MIGRMWRGWTAPERAEGYVGYLEESGVAALRSTPGNQGVLVLHRTDGNREEFLVLSLWESLESVKAFAGEDVTVARFYPRDDEFLVDRELTCSHYEVPIGP
ncbi:MAG TPA: antibiotic biosynthesis monooxygenase [Actinomycetota bacterium]|jgi:heme-degrading monooxygenase HmoA|nr:antibiotic biosynthesis monooxygenase [Actinomycetota bacterium]